MDIARPYSPAADIWSMGCLFSEMLIRASLGEEGVQEYRKARVLANKDTVIRDFAPHCFHDGLKRLACVDEFQAKALEKCSGDIVLRVVSEIVLHRMLQPWTTRSKDALSIRNDWINEIRKADSTLLPSVQMETVSDPWSFQRSPCPLMSSIQAKLQPESSEAGTADTAPPPPPPPPPPQRGGKQAAGPGNDSNVIGPSVSSAPTLTNVTVRDIVNHLNQTPLLSWWLRKEESLGETFPSLVPVLNEIRPRKHVGYKPIF